MNNGKYKCNLDNFYFLEYGHIICKENNERLKLVKNTSNKEQLQLVVGSNTSNFSTLFNPAIQVTNGKSYEIALVDLEKYYYKNISIYNITEYEINYQNKTTEIPVGRRA